MIIESSAPTRVDLAGGTIDIWPLYLFHPGATTVNFALSLRAHCRIETRDDDRIILESRDLKVRFETSLGRIDELFHEERLELLSKLVHFFRPNTGFHLTAFSEVPAGAGLAGSSALDIACVGALNSLVGNRYEQKKFIIVAANVETTVIKVPAGFQDYYSALYGSVSCVHFRGDGIEREALNVDVDELERHDLGDDLVRREVRAHLPPDDRLHRRLRRALTGDDPVQAAGAHRGEAVDVEDREQHREDLVARDLAHRLDRDLPAARRRREHVVETHDLGGGLDHDLHVGVVEVQHELPRGRARRDHLRSGGELSRGYG